MEMVNVYSVKYMPIRCEKRVFIMVKHNKKLAITLVLIIQVTLAITSGLYVIYIANKDLIPPCTYIDSLDIGNKTRVEALSSVKEYYNETAENGELVIELSKENNFSIKLKDIDAVIDYEKTIDQAFNGKRGLLSLLKNYFSKKQDVIYPFVKHDGNRLRKKIEEMAVLVYKPPINAVVVLKDGEVVKVDEQNGLKLNVEYTFNKIKNELGMYLRIPFKLERGTGSAVSVLEPEITLKKLEGMDSIIAHYSTRIKDSKMENDAVEAAKAIDSLLIMPMDGNSAVHNKSSFSFRQQLSNSGIIIERPNEVYNQVASTLYASLLKTGMEIDSIKRSKNLCQVDYIMPGLDVIVDGKDSDLEFKNTLDFPIKIFAKVQNETINIYIVGSKKLGKVGIELEESVVQKFMPSVVTTVNYDLKPGEEKWLSNGKEGIKVEIYRNVVMSGEKAKELLYTDKYEAVDAILQTSPENIPDSRIIK